ncbi:tagatose kinase [Rubellimicrobium aerolatum]|uniref:Sugar kinase n=1 Tax=Rubellimicrobium aerolatum TaxID=490979 RepID=A0ABW0SFU1_9RHOB|nr:fructokinase [Rubellimicrobium aerolatum]
MTTKGGAASDGRRGGLAPDAAGPTVVIGEILVEIMATTRGPGFPEPMPLVGPFPSGAPAIFADQCARMGGTAGLVAAVGDDDFGRLCLRRLAADGVDVSAVRAWPDAPTGTAFVRYRDDGSRDFVFNIARSAAALVSLDEPARRLIARAGHLHVMGSAFAIPGLRPLLDHALDAVRDRGGSVSLDPNLRKELAGDGEARARLDRVIDRADLLLPSGEELLVAAGAGDEDAALAALFARGVGEVALKRGREGATWFGSDGSRHDAPAFDVPEVDPTGAGDCFGGAFVAVRRLGLIPERALLYASAAGARNVTVLGPMGGAGTRAELDAFIAATPRRG